MFDRLRRSGTSARSGDVKPDLSAVPPFAAELPGGLAAVDPEVIGSYLGLSVTSVQPLGGAVNGVAGPAAETPTAESHPLNSLVAGHNAAQEAKLRASGLTDEQIAMVRSKISESAAQQLSNAWTVTFAHGRRATVQVFAVGDTHADFAGYKARYDDQVRRRRKVADGLLDGRVQDVPDAHYETYRLGGVVVARGREHEAVAKCGNLEAPQPDRVLAALAALGLWAVEG